MNINNFQQTFFSKDKKERFEEILKKYENKNFNLRGKVTNYEIEQPISINATFFIDHWKHYCGGAILYGIQNGDEIENVEVLLDLLFILDIHQLFCIFSFNNKSLDEDDEDDIFYDEDRDMYYSVYDEEVLSGLKQLGFKEIDEFINPNTSNTCILLKLNNPKTIKA